MKVRLLTAGRHRVNRGRAAGPLFLGNFCFKRRPGGRTVPGIPQRPGQSESGHFQIGHAVHQLKGMMFEKLDANGG
jgi:hypothetical protein